MDTKFKTVLDIAGIDVVAARTLEQAVRFHGIRTVLDALWQICDYHAERNVELFNTTQAKQWAAWSVAIQAITDSRKLMLTDPGRE